MQKLLLASMPLLAPEELFGSNEPSLTFTFHQRIHHACSILASRGCLSLLQLLPRPHTASSFTMALANKMALKSGVVRPTVSAVGRHLRPWHGSSGLDRSRVSHQ